ncbi:hypothetical protein [Bradyrhizobium sp. P5_C11_2]
MQDERGWVDGDIAFAHAEEAPNPDHRGLDRLAVLNDEILNLTNRLVLVVVYVRAGVLKGRTANYPATGLKVMSLNRVQDPAVSPSLNALDPTSWKWQRIGNCACPVSPFGSEKTRRLL